MRVAGECCDALTAQEGLDVAQVGSALVEEECRGRMAQGMSGNDWYPRALAGELETCVEGLVATGRAVPPRKERVPIRQSRFLRSAAARRSVRSAKDEGFGVEARTPLQVERSIPTGLPRDRRRNGGRYLPAVARRPPLGGVPASADTSLPSSITPAFSHLRTRRFIRRSPMRCSTKRISHS